MIDSKRFYFHTSMWVQRQQQHFGFK